MAEDFIPDEDFTPDTDFVPEKASPLEKAVEPITSYPETYEKMNKEAREQVGQGIEQIGKHESAWDVAKGAGNVALGSLGYVSSPIAAGLRTVVGKPVEDVTGIPKEYTEFAASMALPGYGMTRVPKRVPLPAPPRPGPLGVTLSEGEATGNLPTIQREQRALRGQSGQPAYDAATEFQTQRAGQLERAREGISQDLDPYGGTVAESPQQAADIASERFRQAATNTKAQVRSAYERAQDLGGEIHAGAFEGFGQKVKSDLYHATEPVIVDNLTPQAQKALSYLDETISKMRIPNKADPYGAPNPEGVEGVSLRGVDQIRKNLVLMRNDAYKGTPSDQRAMNAIVKSFDDRVDAAVNGGLFTGDQRAVDAWNVARRANTLYRSTFGKRAGDPIGNMVEKVLGGRGNEPASPNAVADFLYGSSRVNPNDVNVGVANRFKRVLGANSPQWSGVKQGLWHNLIERGEGLENFNPKQQADRINKFLNVDGREMSRVLYSADERAAMQSYADLLRQIQVPQAGVNWSNHPVQVYEKIGAKVGDWIAGAIGGGTGHLLGLPPGIGETVGAGVGVASRRRIEAFGRRKEAKAIAEMMPVLSRQMQAWGRAYTASQNRMPVSQRALLGSMIPLDSTLRKLGTSFQEITHGTIPAAAEPEQNKRDGGRTNKPNHRAGNDPPMHGARRAPDGHWYLADKSRPGKYLRVET